MTREEAEAFLIAFLENEDELARIVGSEWPSIIEALRPAIQQVRSGSEVEGVREIIKALARHRDAVSFLLARARSRRESPLRTISAVTGHEAALSLISADASAEPLIRHADVAFPERVGLDAKRVLLVVRLTIKASPQGSTALQVQRTPVRVTVFAPAFEHLNSFDQQTPILDDADSPPLVFDLRPTTAGKTHVVVNFFQNNSPIGTASLDVEVTEEAVPDPGALRPTLQITSQSDVRGADYVLLIHYEPVGEPRLVFDLLVPAAASFIRFPPVKLTADPAAYAGELFQELETLREGKDPGAASQGATVKVTKKNIAERIKDIGGALYNDLFPDDFRRIYQRDRSRWAGKSLLVQSDEPWIPWELVWPYFVDESGNLTSDDAPWCETMLLSRWLQRQRNLEHAPSPPPSVEVRDLAVVAPTDSDLPSAQRERAALRDFAAAKRLSEVSPPAGDETLVRQRLSAGCDWVHFAAHGVFEKDGSSPMLFLERSVAFKASAVSRDIEAAIRRRRSMFFFNACQAAQQGFALTHVDGWAYALIAAGASLFLAPRWSVSDDVAFEFSKTFYEALARGRTAAEAVGEARAAAKQQRAGDPTYLAYSLYAHPNAKVAFLPGQSKG